MGLLSAGARSRETLLRLGLIVLALGSVCASAASTAYTTGNQAPKTFPASRTTALPLLSPDNSLYALQKLLDSAQKTLFIENQYITKFSTANWLLGIVASPFQHQTMAWSTD